MAMKENIEKIFIMDSRDKKRTGASVTKRARRRGYCRGGIKFPSDYLSRKEKKLLNGEVKVSHVLDNIKNVPSLEAINKMSNEEAKRILEVIKSKHSQEDIAKHFGVKKPTLYYYYRKFDVDVRNFKRIGKGNGKFNSIDDVLSFDKIKAMDPKEIREYLYECKKQFGTRPLLRHWGISAGTIHNYFEKYDTYKMEQEQLEKNKKILNDIPTWKELVELPINIQKGYLITIVESGIDLKEVSKVIKVTESKLENKLKQLDILKTEIEPTQEVLNNIDDSFIVEKEEAIVEPINKDKTTNELLKENIINQLEEEINILKNNMKALEEEKLQKQNNCKFKIEFTGVCEKEEIENRLKGIAGTTIQDKKYKINITLEEI